MLNGTLHFVDPKVLQDPRPHIKALTGVELVVARTVKPPTLGQVEGHPKHLVNPVWSVTGIHTVDGKPQTESVYCKLFSNDNGEQVVQRTATPAQEAERRRVRTLVRKQLIDEYLIPRAKALLAEGKDFAETGAELFGLLAVAEVIEDPEQCLLDLLNAHFVDGDPNGEERPNGGANGQGRSYQETVWLGALTDARGQWAVGDGAFQERPGALGIDRLVRHLCCEATARPVVDEHGQQLLTDKGNPKYHIDFPVTSMEFGGETIEAFPVFKPNVPNPMALYQAVRSMRALDESRIRIQPIPPAFVETVVELAALAGTDQAIAELYAKSGSQLSLEEWRNYRPRSGGQQAPDGGEPVEGMEAISYSE
jgi:hypothetical protein